MIKEAMDRAAASARRVKEQHIAECKVGDGTDIMTFIEGYRGDETVVTVGLPPDRDEMLKAVNIIARAFSADVVAFTMETFHSTHPTSPMTGEDWEPGEMGRLAAGHDGIAKGWVSEALVTTVANRAGDQVSVIQPYTLGKMARRVTIRWTETTSSLDVDGIELQGIVPEAVARIMNEPTLDQMMAAHVGISGVDFGLSPAAARAHQDLAGLRVLREHLSSPVMTAMLPVDPKTERGQILMKRLREMESE